MRGKPRGSSSRVSFDGRRACDLARSVTATCRILGVPSGFIFLIFMCVYSGLDGFCPFFGFSPVFLRFKRKQFNHFLREKIHFFSSARGIELLLVKAQFFFRERCLSKKEKKYFFLPQETHILPLVEAHICFCVRHSASQKEKKWEAHIFFSWKHNFDSTRGT